MQPSAKSKSAFIVNELVKNRQRKNSTSSLPLSIPKLKDFEGEKNFRLLIEFGAGAASGAVSRTLYIF